LHDIIERDLADAWNFRELRRELVGNPARIVGAAALSRRYRHSADFPQLQCSAFILPRSLSNVGKLPVVHRCRAQLISFRQMGELGNNHGIFRYASLLEESPC
jgi:hypothetical protein